MPLAVPHARFWAFCQTFLGHHAGELVSDPTIPVVRSVLVDHRRTLAVVPHPGHEIPELGAAGRSERVACMAQIVKMQAFGVNRLHRLRPGRHLVEVAPPERAALDARELRWILIFSFQ